MARQPSSRTVILEDVTSGISVNSDEQTGSSEQDIPVTTQPRDYGACDPSSSDSAEELSRLIDKKRTCCSSTNFLGTILFLVALLTTASFSVPLFFHYLYHPEPKHHHHSHNFSCDSMENCSLYDNQANHNYSCIAKPYTRVHLPTICKNVLRNWQCCLPDHDEQEILVNATTPLRKDVRRLIITLESIKSDVISSECKRPAVQFLCQFAFPLCDNQTSTLLLPKKKQCTDLRDKYCVSQWKFFQQYYPGDVPNCDKLPGPNTAPPGQNENNITCSNMFIKRNGYCSPDCTKLSTMDYNLSIFCSIIFPLLLGFGLIAAVGVIAIFVINRKKMCFYPLLYVLYMTVAWMGPAILTLVGKFDRSLFCNGWDVDKTLNFNSTTFCIINGVTLHWFFSSTTFVWLFLVLSILYKAGRHNPTQLELKMSKYVHIMLTVIGFLVPLPAIVINLVKEGRDGSYAVPFFPPFICMGKNSEVTYYSIILEVNILMGIGTNLYLIAFWLMFKYRNILKARGETALGRLSVAEMKLPFLYLYYILFAIIILLYDIIGNQDHILKDLEDYFVCENSNKQVNGCTKQLSILQKNSLNTLLVPLLVSLACFPFCNLLFVLNWKRVWNLSVSCCRALKDSLPQPPSTVYSTLTRN